MHTFLRTVTGLALGLGLGLGLTMGCPAAHAAPEPFGPHTWSQLQREVRTATWVVFSASDCSHCPSLLTQLRAEYPHTPLWWVQTDAGAEAPPVAVERELSFGEGHAMALRHRVNPQWPGMTPYLALLRPSQAPLFALAQPSPAQRRALEKAGQKPIKQ